MRDRSGQGLDWLNFFVSNVQTGFGPFIASYLASQAWTQGQIGLALSIGTVTTMVAQLPAGAAVDAMRRKRRLAGGAIVAIAVAALILAAFPDRLPVTIAEILHGLASCLLGPVIAALSLAVAEARGMSVGERLGRNARFASIGSGIAAGLMGGVGYLVSEASVFLLAALLVLPALWALSLLPASEADAPPGARQEPLWRALSDWRLLVWGICCAGFHLSNAAMFPLAAVEVTRQSGSVGELVIAACMIVPQFLVAALSPLTGRLADRWGRRPVLIVGFAFVPLRGVLFALLTTPPSIVVIQSLDGISGAVFGVMLPLVVSDLSRDHGRFNLSLGAIGLMIAGAAAISTEVAGLAADVFSTQSAFLALAGAGIAATLLLAVALPETKPMPDVTSG